MYAAVLTGKHPEMVKQLFAYQTMMLREARRCGGSGWQTYDSYFRQQVAGNPTADWSSLNTALYAVTFLSQSNKSGTNCTLCMGSDHTSQECAITLHQPRQMLPAKRSLRFGEGQATGCNTVLFCMESGGMPLSSMQVQTHVSPLLG